MKSFALKRCFFFDVISSRFRNRSAFGAAGLLPREQAAAPARLPEGQAPPQARERVALEDADRGPDRDQQQHRGAAQDPLPRAQDEDDRDGRELEELERDAELDELRGGVVPGGVDHEVALVAERRHERVRGSQHDRRRHHDGLDAQRVPEPRGDGVDERRGGVVGDDLGEEARDLGWYFVFLEEGACARERGREVKGGKK